LRHFLVAIVEGRLEEEGFRLAWLPSDQPYDGFRMRVLPSAKPSEILLPGSRPFEKLLSFQTSLVVMYLREEVEPQYVDFLTRQATSDGHFLLSEVLKKADMAKFDFSKQISVLRLDGPPVIVNMDGNVSNPLALICYGYWSYERVGEMLPLDYSPHQEGQ
jgi:hypothetical protein